MIIGRFVLVAMVVPNNHPIITLINREPTSLRGTSCMGKTILILIINSHSLFMYLLS